ncbi:MAG: HAMP domain-containing histidine kinase, partial [Cyanobacteria bacterium]|nr:HAMP domain-containing histidine kinase [Cyanobacteriota bacterium]
SLSCLECNEEFVGIVGGVDRNQLIGRSITEIAPRLTESIFREVIETGHPCRRTQDRIALSPDSHDETYWDWAAWPVKEGTNVTGLVAMFANATDSVLLQQQREDFVATLTHDLKTPVSATNRAVRFLLDGDFGPVSEAQKEILETILQSNNALYSLVQTLLDVYKFDSGVKEFHMRNCNLAGTIAQMITEVMPLAQSVGVELRAVLPSDAQDIKCDEEELRRLLQNLLDNSLKYTPSGGSVQVTMSQEGGKTKVSVSDTGRGIPEENMPKLFQRFWQAGSTGRYYASTGLGLYLCRRIVEGHGGRIWCTSTPGEGSIFTFEI